MSAIWIVAFVAQWILLITLFLLMIGLLRYVAPVKDHIDATVPHISRYDVGDRLADFALPDLDGRMISSASILQSGQRALILLVSAGCSPCKTLVMQLEELFGRTGQVQDSWTVALIFGGERHMVSEMLNEHGTTLRGRVRILVDEDDKAKRLFGVRHSPVGMVVARDGRLVTQSIMPYANWLYKVFNVLPPKEVIVDGEHGGWEPLLLTTGSDDYMSR